MQKWPHFSSLLFSQAAFEKRLMVKTVLHFETGNKMNNVFLEITVCIFCASNYKLTRTVGLFPTSSSYHLNQMCSGLRWVPWHLQVHWASGHPLLREIPSNRGAAWAKHHNARSTPWRWFTCTKNKSWGWACDWRSWPQSGLKLDQLWRTRRVTHHCKRGKTKTISSHVNKFNTSH